MNVERLPGGWMNEARLVNGRVHRPLGPHSAFVHQLLRFLSDVGFGGAPSILRVEGDEEVLTYIEGHVPVEHPRHVEPVVFSDAGVESSLRLIRLLHDMTAGSALAGDAEVVCHGDLVPWNTVYDAQGAIALIDWDNASPAPRAHDVGFAVWRYLRLGLPDASSLADQRRQLRLIADTYGDWTPPELLHLAADGQRRHRQHFEERQADGDVRYLRLIELGALGYIDNARRWLDTHAADLL